MKRALVIILNLAALLVLASCGGGNDNPTPQDQTSGIAKRVLITDRFNGFTYIFDGARDLSLGHRINTGLSSSIMALTSDKKSTVVVNGTTSSSVSAIDNSKEALSANFVLPESVFDIAVASDNKTVYAALRNAPVTGQLNGLIEILDLTATTGAPSGNIPVPSVRRLALSRNGSKLLAFSDNSDQVAVIDTATKVVTNVSGFDRPVFAVFSADDATAYVLSCGKECGGTTARVNALTLATNAVGANVVVNGATAALLDGGNLYVAGNSTGNGKLDVISTSNMTVSKSGVAIVNGYHSVMVLASNGRLFIGSTGCDNLTSGCLSVYNTSSGSVVNSAAGGGNVTGVQPIEGRSIVYVIEGGELVFWDTTTDAPLPAAKQVDIVGQAYDVKLID